MTKASAKKICIVVSSLGGGGAERSSALLSELLFDLGFEIHIVSILDKIDYPYKGKLFNLGKLKSEDDSSLGRLKRLKIFKNYLKEHEFDYVIDNRTRIGFLKEFVITKLIYNTKKTIYCVHSFKTSMYINPNPLFGKWFYNQASKIVCVSKAISNKLNAKYSFNNLEVIYNTVSKNIVEETKEAIESEQYILFYGRIEDDVKNISLLLEAYSKSKLPEANINLKILGEGNDKDMLKKKIENLQLMSKVKFLDFQINPYNTVKQAYFTVLTSHFEGFPMVLVESLALGTPVVSVDCKSGPNEIVLNEQNGLLVENYNIDALVNAMNRMLDDKDLYLRCKSNTKTSIKAFSREQITKQWQTILQ